MRQLILFAALALLGVSKVQAQTVSIVNTDTSREAILLEATLKRFLRDDGYTVKGASTEGFVVLLHGLTDQQGAPSASVLIVDDDPDICEVLTDLVRSEGDDVEHAWSGTDALAKI